MKQKGNGERNIVHDMATLDNFSKNIQQGYREFRRQFLMVIQEHSAIGRQFQQTHEHSAKKLVFLEKCSRKSIHHSNSVRILSQ